MCALVLADLKGNHICKHRCDNEKCIVDCEKLNLFSIPTCEMIGVKCGSVTELKFNRNSLKSIPPAGFAHFYNLRILDLTYNPLETCTNTSFLGLDKLSRLYLCSIQPFFSLKVETGVFRPLTSLKLLNLTWSSMHIPTLFQSFCSLSENIETILMDHMDFITSLDFELTKCFQKLKLKHLSVENCHIHQITASVARNFKSLQHLSLRNNKIVSGVDFIGFLELRNLTYLDVSCQNSRSCNGKYPWSEWLHNEPKMFKENTTIITNLNSTTIQTNTSMPRMFMLPNLQTLLLHHITLRVTSRPIVCWVNNRLLNVDLSFVQTIRVHGVIPCPQYVKFLNVRGINSLPYANVDALHDMPSLEILLVGSAGIPDGILVKHDAPSLLAKNPNLRFLDLSNLGLTALHKNIFSHSFKLESLILSHNKFNNVHLFLKNLPALKKLDLSYNDMREIPLSTIVHMERSYSNTTDKKMLNLSNNPFLCLCSSIYPIEQILNSKMEIHDAKSKNGSLRCTLVNNQNIPITQAYQVLKSQCRKIDMVSIVCITILYPITLCITVIITCCLRYSWTVKYAWYNLANWIKGRELADLNEQIIFDAFVAHSSKDEEWICNSLLKRLENRDHPYSICVHHRCFLPGETIADNIISAIYSSKTTILVVSKAFMRSGWCDFESNVAQQHHLGKTNHRIIAILFPGVYKSARKKPSLKTLLDNVTCLEWPKDKHGQEVFWLRLCHSLGQPIDLPADYNYMVRPLAALFKKNTKKV